MSQPHDSDYHGNDDEEESFRRLEELLTAMLGKETASDAIEALRASGMTPSTLAHNGMIPDLNAMSPAALMALHAQMQQIMASAAGSSGVNWELGGQVARQVIAGKGDPVVTAARAQEVSQALSVADLWLDAVTDLDPAPGSREVWSRAQWLEHTQDAWQDITEPVAQAVVTALSKALDQQMGDTSEDPDLARQMHAIGGMMDMISGTAFGMQVGHAIGELATEIVSSTDVGLPLSRTPGTALVPAGVDAFAEGLDVASSDVLMFLAVREVAAARLYAHVPWLRAEILEAVAAYAGEIRVDTAAVEEAVSHVDASDPQAIQQALASGVFTPKPSEAQNRALEHLETLLALVEGWVDVVSAQALAAHVPGAMALSEMWRRRRLEGGSAEKIFARLLGMEFRPRRVREAVRLWTILGQQAGAAERDAFWLHPDVMPTAAELDAPEDFLTMREAARDMDAEIDADLASLLDGTLGYAGEAKDADSPDSPEPQS